MKAKKKIMFLIAFPVVAVVACYALRNGPETSSFPKGEAVKSCSSGELVAKTAEIEIGSKVYQAQYATLTVPENHANPAGKLISLPVLSIYSNNPSPSDPIFTLGGGPGMTNISDDAADWALDKHDVVMVGYRGVDGSVSLDCPEVAANIGGGSKPLAAENLRKIGLAYERDFERLKKEGIDVDRYTIIDVIDDIEIARAALGYNRINLYSESYGTRVAYLYGVRFPQSIHRSLMVGVNPPGHFVWEPEINDGMIKRYSELWKMDKGAVARTPDLERTIKNVLATLPRRWLGFNIDADKVRSMTFLMMYHQSTAIQVFDAYVAAEQGDYSGLAFMSFMFDRMIGGAVNWGDNISKAMSADFDPSRDYLNDMMPENAILGSPFSKMLDFLQHGWTVPPIPEKYRKLQPSDVETLMVNGNLDISTPAQFARDELLPCLENGSLVVLKEMGHVSDVLNLQPAAFSNLAGQFFDDGRVDESRFTHQRVNFVPDQSFPSLAKRFVAIAVTVLVLVILGLAFAGWYIRRRWMRRREIKLGLQTAIA
jgi:pimeloyl-ACP methyl ester carboxylesterase